MTNEKITKNGYRGIGALFYFAFLFVSLNIGGYAFADTPTVYVGDIHVLSNTEITASSEQNNYVNLNFTNVSSAQGATVYVKGLENVTTIEVLVEGTSCGSATVGVFSIEPFDCDSAISTDALNGDVNVSLQNDGSNPIKVAAWMGVRYQQQRADNIDTSTLATSAEVQSVNNTVNQINTTANTINANTDGIETTQAEHTTTLGQINTTANNIQSDTDDIQSTLSTLVADIWSYATRTLTSLKQSIIDLS